MGFFSDIASFGSKALGTVENLANKGWSEVNSLGTKATNFAQEALNNPLVAELGMSLAPELYEGAQGALGTVKGVLNESKQWKKEIGDTLGWNPPAYDTIPLAKRSSMVDNMIMKPLNTKRNDSIERQPKKVVTKTRKRGSGPGRNRGKVYA